MKKTNLLSFALLISALLLLLGCSSPSNQNQNSTANSTPNITANNSQPPAHPSDDYRKCSTNADCVPQDCCHSMKCVNSKYAPVCDGVMCSQDCRSGTTDCGGGCACLNNLCEAIATR
ncbi:Uncharacterised protein [Candidatus Gugararchaeum adminiculabundum]|nr:Uncharacterised protein [Candidatus Gugararchaeum adminiculabundum]